MRYVFNSPIYGIDEFVVFLLVWYASIGFAVITWNNGHAKIEVLGRHMPVFIRTVVQVASCTISAVFGGILIAGGRTLFSIQVKSPPLGGLSFSRAYYYSLPMIVLGVLLILLAFIRILAYLFLRENELVEKKQNAEGDV